MTNGNSPGGEGGWAEDGRPSYLTGNQQRLIAASLGLP